LLPRVTPEAFWRFGVERLDEAGLADDRFLGLRVGVELTFGDSEKDNETFGNGGDEGGEVEVEVEDGLVRRALLVGAGVLDRGN
jgi:hypothetical protein